MARPRSGPSNRPKASVPLKNKSKLPAVTGVRWAPPRALDVLLIASALSVLVFTFYATWQGYSAMPFADAWTVHIAYAKNGMHVPFAHLFDFHSEHRPAVARIAILADMLWFGSRGFFTTFLIFAIQAAHAYLLYWIASRQSWFEARHRALAISLAVFCCFSPAQLENFIWSFQVAFLLNFFLATAAVVAVAMQRERPQSPVPIVAVFLCALLAPLNLASGVFVWWIAIGAAIAIRLPRTWISIYVVSAILTFVLYVQGYQRPKIHNDPMEALGKPLAMIQYAGTYFGTTWALWSIWFGELLTLIALILMLDRIVSLVKRRPANAWESVPPAVMLFSLINALLAALGRLNFGPQQAGSSRYQTPALVFFAMATMLLVPWLMRSKGPWLTAFQVFLVVAMLSVFTAGPSTLKRVRGYAEGWNRSQAAWTSGVSDSQAFDLTMAGNELPLRAAYFEQHSFLFGFPPGSEAGRIIPPERIERQQECQGTFVLDADFPDQTWPGRRWKGAARRRSDGKPIHYFITINNADHRVVGVGIDDVAYAAGVPFPNTIGVYGMLDGGKVCPIETR